MAKANVAKNVATNGAKGAQVTAAVTPTVDPIETWAHDFSAHAIEQAEALSGAFRDADTQLAGGGYDAYLAASEQLGFDPAMLKDWNPSEKTNKIELAVQAVHNIAHPTTGKAYRDWLSALIQDAVNSLAADEASLAREGENGTADKPSFGKVPVRQADKDDEEALDLIRGRIEQGGDSENDADRRAIVETLLAGLESEEPDDRIGAVRRIGRLIGNAQVGATRFRAAAIFLPMLTDVLDDYEDRTKGTAAPSRGRIWQDLCNAVQSAHKGAWRDENKKPRVPSQADIDAAINAAIDKTLGSKEELAAGKEKAGEDEQKAGLLKTIYASLRKLDTLTGSAHNLYASCAPMLKTVGTDAVQADKDAKEQAKKDAAAQAKADQLAAVQAKRANKAGATVATDVNKAAAGKAANATKKPTPAAATIQASDDMDAELAELEQEVSQPAASAPVVEVRKLGLNNKPGANANKPILRPRR